ncbi:UNVERIFIED_CONTAM: hypothetical protein HDU68_012927 [Siphonaria sp. JEL0065]|nr:hypothetical protein HDU68_012927 [Siphonaria sp. JEL0065]
MPENGNKTNGFNLGPTITLGNEIGVAFSSTGVVMNAALLLASWRYRVFLYSCAPDSNINLGIAVLLSNDPERSIVWNLNFTPFPMPSQFVVNSTAVAIDSKRYLNNTSHFNNTISRQKPKRPPMSAQDLKRLKTVNTLFLLGMSFLPIMAISMVFMYAQSYFLVAKTLSTQLKESDVEDEVAEDIHKIPQKPNEDNLEQQTCHRPTNHEIQKSVGRRISLMSIGLIVFYLPVVGAMLSSMAGLVPYPNDSNIDSDLPSASSKGLREEEVDFNIIIGVCGVVLLFSQTNFILRTDRMVSLYPEILATTLTQSIILAKFPELTYNGSLVMGGYDNINVTEMSDLNQWGWPSWWYWNQQAMQFAIDFINNDPTVLANTTIKIKTFNNHELAYKNGSPGKAISVAKEIVENHKGVFESTIPYLIQDVVAIPQCTGSVFLTSLWDRNIYNYYFQTIALTGYAQSIGLLLRKWNVKRIAMMDVRPFSDPFSDCGYISRVLEKEGFKILTRIDVGKKVDLEYITKALGQVDARYIMLCGAVAGNAQIYFELAHRKQYVGPGYVWLMDNMPFSSNPDDVERWGPDYYKNARGIFQTFGMNTYTQQMLDQETDLLKAINDFQAPWGAAFDKLTVESWFNILQMYECPRIFANGLNNLLKNPEFTLKMAENRELQEYMNYTLFMDTGYRGILGDPLQLSEKGDLATSYTLMYVDGESEALGTVGE